MQYVCKKCKGKHSVFVAQESAMEAGYGVLLCVFLCLFSLLTYSCFYGTTMGHYTWYLVTCIELSLFDTCMGHCT
jgi:hypothetical protein